MPKLRKELCGQCILQASCKELHVRLANVFWPEYTRKDGFNTNPKSKQNDCVLRIWLWYAILLWMHKRTFSSHNWQIFSFQIRTWRDETTLERRKLYLVRTPLQKVGLRCWNALTNWFHATLFFSNGIDKNRTTPLPPYVRHDSPYDNKCVKSSCQCHFH